MAIFNLKVLVDNINLYKTVCMFIAIIVSGFGYGIVGPTLLHLEYLLHTNTQNMAIVFSIDSVGSFIGSIISGFHFDKFSYEFQFFQYSVLAGILTCLSTFMGNIYTFGIIMFIRSVIGGYSGSGARPYLLRLWTGSKYKSSVFQASEVVWAIGAFISPLCVIPFLSEIPKFVDTKSESKPLLANDKLDYEALTYVRYPHIMVGMMTITTGTLFYHVYILKKSKSIEKTTFENTDGNTLEHTGYYDNSSTSRKLQNFLFAQVFLYACFVIWQGHTLGTFLSVFVIKGLGWSVEKGPLITSLFRGTQAIVRFLGVFISMYLSPTQILTINMIFGITAYTTLYVAVNILHSESLIWISVVMSSFAVSNSFPTIVLWGSQYLPVKASYGSLFSAAGSVGGMTCISLVGYLFENVTKNAIIYVALFGVICNSILFVVMHITVRSLLRFRLQVTSTE